MGLRLAVLGPLSAWQDGEPLDLGPVRQQALLAALVLRSDVRVSRQQLLDDVWGLEPPGTGTSVVPVYVHRLRKCLQGDLIVSERGGYRFLGAATDAAELDQHASEASAAARSGDLAGAVVALTEALALFRGEPLAGLPGPFAAGQRHRLTERRITLQLRKSEWQLKLGSSADVVAELGELASAHPHHEPLAGLLMRALVLAGRRADALDVFARLRERLAEDLGVGPGAEIRQLHETVLRNESAPRRQRNELPVAGVLVGRDGELTRLVDAPDAPDAVCAVDGVAGSGKTALVVHVAHRLRARFPDGCLFVDLHGHTAGRDPLPPRVSLRRLLRAIGVDDNADDLDELAASWRSSTASLRLLLVLDNAASAEQVRELLPAGPGCRVLVTSRQRLAGLPAGTRVSLGPLDITTAEQLLTRIAPRSESAHELALLCGRLPLALCIAGARLQTRPMWTYDDLASRLADDSRRLGELVAEDRSVEAALRLSHDQLGPEEQRVFRVLGLVPTVEFDPLAVAALLDSSPWDAERALENLVDANLVQQPATGRYRLHDLVGVFARRVASGERERVLHLYVAAARYASDWGVVETPELGDVPFTGWEDASAWLDAVGGEIVEVVRYAATFGFADHACWIAEGAVEYLTRQGRFHEARAALEIAFPLVERCTDRRMVTAMRTGFAIAHGMAGGYETAHAWLQDALELSGRTGDRRERARALGGLGALARARGESDEAYAALGEALEIGREISDDWLAGMAVTNLGEMHHQDGDTEEAFRCLAEGVEYADKLGNPRSIAMGLAAVGSVYLGMERHEDALTALARAAELAEQVSDRPLHALCVTRQASATQALGLPGASDLHRRALAAITEDTRPDLAREVRDRAGDLAFHPDFNGGS